MAELSASCEIAIVASLLTKINRKTYGFNIYLPPFALLKPAATARLSNSEERRDKVIKDCLVILEETQSTSTVFTFPFLRFLAGAGDDDDASENGYGGEHLRQGQGIHTYINTYDNRNYRLHIGVHTNECWAQQLLSNWYKEIGDKRCADNQECEFRKIGNGQLRKVDFRNLAKGKRQTHNR